MSSKTPVITVTTVAAIAIACFFVFKKGDETSPPKPTQEPKSSRSTGNSPSPAPPSHTSEKTERTAASSQLNDISAVNEQGSDAVKAYVLDLLKKNEQEGLEFLAGLEDNLDYESMGQAVYDHFILNGRYLDGLDAFKILDKNLTLATPLLHSFVSEYYRNEPKAALTWISENPELNGIENAAYEVGALSAKTEEPASEIKSMLDSELSADIRTTYLNGAMEVWMEDDLDGALQFFATADLSSFYYDETIYLMAGKAVEVDPSGAMQWAETIVDEQYRYSALSEVSRSWSSTNSTEFEQWLGEQSPKMQEEIAKIRKDLE